MTVSEANAIIETIANKFGTTAEFLVPEIIKYNIVTISSTIIFLTILVIVCIKLFITGWKKIKEPKDGFDDDLWDAVCFGSFLGGIILGAIDLVCINCLIGWIVAPYGAIIANLFCG